MTKRIRIHWLLGLLMPLLLAAWGCTQTSVASTPEGTEYVVFVDFSDSIRKDGHNLFLEDLTRQIIPTLAAGDHILIAAISDKTLTAFRPLVEETFPAQPRFNGWSQNLLQYKAVAREIKSQVPKSREKVHQGVKKIFSGNRSSLKTDIFSSLTLAEKLFHNVPRNKVLVLMSDMIEDYPPYRFDRMTWTEESTEELLMELDDNGMIPDLSDVCVYISGVSAQSPRMAADIGSFWTAYFKRANADMHPSRYAHVLLHWPPSKSCVESS